MKFQEIQIAITDTTHCRAVCDVLESLGYKSFTLQEFAVSEDGTTGIVAFADGTYTDTSSAPVYGKITTLQDLLSMRDDLVRQKAEQRAVTEYLDPKDWSLKIVRADQSISSDWIKVPEGAAVYAEHRNFSERHFFSSTGKDRKIDWDGTWIPSRSQNGEPLDVNFKILWTRATHPEELPFIDDDPPAYYGNAIRPKPRQRVYAVMGPCCK